MDKICPNCGETLKEKVTFKGRGLGMFAAYRRKRKSLICENCGYAEYLNPNNTRESMILDGEFDDEIL